MAYIDLTAVLTLSLAVSMASAAPSEPLLAVNEGQVTDMALQHQQEEFRWLAKWYRAMGNEKMAVSDSNTLKRELERLRPLKQQGIVTDDQFADAELKYKVKINDIAQWRGEADRADAEFTVAKLELLAECNRATEANAKYLIAITEARLRAAQAKVEILESMIKSANAASQSAALYRDFGRFLLNRTWLSQDQFDHREANATDDAQTETELRNLESVAEAEIKALNKTLDNLRNPGAMVNSSR